MKIADIEKLAKIMKENELTALEVTEGETNIVLERKPLENVVYNTAPAMPAVVPVAPAAATTPISGAPAAELNPVTEGEVITSPTVGVFYAASSPDSEPFVKIGSKVKKGDVLCIVEAMKLMNEITSEVEGEIVDILVTNGQVVEFSQPLFRVK